MSGSQRQQDAGGSWADERPSTIHAAAHELRTPLTAILGFAEVLRLDGPSLDPEEFQRMIGHIITNAKAEVLIIDRWLDGISDNGDGRGHFVTLKLRAEIDALAEDIAPLLNGHRVDLDIPAKLEVLAQADALREVMSNLLINAVKYSYENSTITVSAERTLAYITVSVHSVSATLTSDELSHLFEEGYRVSRGGKQLGSGLGLSIARDLVTRLGGEIWAESDDDGTSFKFTLRRLGVASSS